MCFHKLEPLKQKAIEAEEVITEEIVEEEVVVLEGSRSHTETTKGYADTSLSVIDERVVLGKNFKIYGTVENPLFLAKDVAEWIEYRASDTYKLVANVDDDEKVLKSIQTLGGKYNIHKMLMTIDEDEKTVVTMVILDKDGVYRQRRLFNCSS